MASVMLFDAARMQEIEDGTVVSGLVDMYGHLILTTHAGDTIDAGNVKGETGNDGTDAEAVLEVVPGTTVDLALSGLGTLASPWSLTAEVEAVTLARITDLEARMDKKESIPAFLARGSGTVAKSSTASYSKLVWNSTVLNVGSCFNLANSRFIAPVDGLYSFSFALAATTSAGGPEVSIYKNGSVEISNLAIGYGAEYNSFGTSFPMVLDSGESIEIWWQNNNNVSVSIDRSRSTFGGNLIEEY